jgi:hypothetical protein
MKEKMKKGEKVKEIKQEIRVRMNEGEDKKMKGEENMRDEQKVNGNLKLEKAYEAVK